MLQNIINNEFEQFVSRFGKSAIASDKKLHGSFIPGVNITEKDNVVRVEAELPGIAAKDVNVTLEDNTLTIQGERKQNSETKNQQTYRREFSYGAFRRSIALPGEADPSKAQAVFKDGILTIELPVAARKPSGERKIPIRSE
jgi:HSP20 family protein